MVYFILVSATGNYISNKIDTVIPNYAAQIYGIKENDEILKIDGKTIRLKSDIDKAVQKSNGNEIILTVKRENKVNEIKLIPTKDEFSKSYKIGVTFKLAENSFLNNIYYGFWDTLDFSVSIVDNIKLLFTGNVSTDDLIGPVGISEVVSKTKGIEEFTYMLALISLSLRSNELASISTFRWR